jgi:hypothetical protein
MTPRLSFAPVDAYLRATHAVTDDERGLSADRVGAAEVVARLGSLACFDGRTPSVRTIQRWRKVGLDVWSAESTACALGMVPYDPRLWGSEWDRLVDEVVARWAVRHPQEAAA